MINKLGFGFLRLPKNGDQYDWELLCRMVDRFMEQGGVYFDTCYTYLNGQSEEGIRRCVAARKPRTSFQLAEKLPGYLCRTYEDCQRYMEEELRRCGVDYFDMFMLHWLSGENYRIAEQLDQFRFLREQKEKGTAKRIGFSYHDSAALLDEILTAHPEVDVVQLQINYLDWDTAGIESRKCYETAVRHGKKVIVMEPVKGGTLANIPAEAEKRLRAVHPDWSPADWALRFVQSLPEVEICLSGMNAMEQVERNMVPFAPLEPWETALLMELRSIIIGKTAIACTGCRYCEPHCPRKLPIPELFRLYNEITREPQEDWKIQPSYQQLAKRRGAASGCIACGKCRSHCPQGLLIPEYMKDVAARFERTSECKENEG